MAIAETVAQRTPYRLIKITKYENPNAKQPTENDQIRQTTLLELAQGTKWPFRKGYKDREGADGADYADNYLDISDVFILLQNEKPILMIAPDPEFGAEAWNAQDQEANISKLNEVFPEYVASHPDLIAMLDDN